MHRRSLSLALLLFIGCGGDDGTNNMSIQCGPNLSCPTGYVCNASTSLCLRVPDAGSATPDATTAAQPDASPTPVADAPPGMVTVIVINRGERVAGAPVVFSSSDGALLGTATTDDNGTVTHTLPANGMVTAVYEDEHQLNTVAAVQPGETIRIVANTQAEGPSGTQVGLLTIVPPGPATGATIYSLNLVNSQAVLGGATETSPDPVTVGVAQYQVENGMVHVRALAGQSDWTDYSAVEVPFLGGNTTATLPAWQPLASSELTLNNVPSWLASYQIGNGLESVSVQPTAASATLRLVPDPPYLLNLSSDTFDDTGCSDTSGIRTLTAAPTTATVDVGQSLLPLLGDLDTSAFVGAGASFTWVPKANLDDAGAVGGEITASWTVTVNENTFGYLWTLETPPATEAILPILPSAYDSWLPPADSNLDIRLHFFDISPWASYADYKAHYFEIYGVSPAPPWREVDFQSGVCD